MTKPYPKQIAIGSTIVEMKGITKRFSGLTANDHIDFSVNKGEIHALLGENGAGKTTLMKILYGLYRLDDGEIYIKGIRIVPNSPKNIIPLGLGIVQQHFALVPKFSVAENIVLGLKSPKEPLIDLKEAKVRILELSKKFGLQVDPEEEVWRLSVGEQQRVEILKALYRDADVLILDEPTAVLTPQEIDSLLATLRFMVDSGLTIIFITHKLPEVFAVSNRVTVLRDGKVMGILSTNETSEQELAKLMFGREINCITSRRSMDLGTVVLETKDLDVLDDRGLPAVKNVSFKLHAGEILGIAGVAGNGQWELAEAIAGLRKVHSGRIFLKGDDITNRAPRDLITRGFAYVPEDRMVAGMVMDFSIAENCILTSHSESPFCRSRAWIRFLNTDAIDAHAERLILEFGVKAQGRFAAARTLSGGNIQRLILARELSRGPSVIIANKPTRGLDAESTAFIRNKLFEGRDKGTGIVLISEDLEEVCLMSDRIMVMYEGRIVGEAPAAKASYEEIGLMMAGMNSSSSQVEQQNGNVGEAK